VPEGARGRHFDATNKAAVRERLRGWGEPVPSLLAVAEEGEIACRDIYGGTSLVTWGVGRVTLLGDAAHPMTTTQGQGACAAIEDALVLQHCLMADKDVAAALRTYEARRRDRTDGLMRVSKQLESRARIKNPARVWIRNRMIGLIFGNPWLVQRIAWYQGMTQLV
jgi:2-polyprenyl-6-methoxyphenol hydroxylase-like FAD-dependent oxidoreductase